MKDMLRISRRALLGGIASAAALPLLPATGFAQAKKTGGTLTMVTWPAATYLTSAINTSGAETLISGKLYEGLLEYDVGMVPTPGLAESFEVAVLFYYLRSC